MIDSSPLKKLIPNTIKAIASDLDGTLSLGVGKDNQTVLDLIIAILKLQKAHFFLVTGRKYISTKVYYQKIIDDTRIGNDDLKFLHAYIANGTAAYNVLADIGSPYYAFELNKYAVAELGKFFDKQGWLTDSSLLIDIPSEHRFKIMIRNSDGSWGNRLEEIGAILIAQVKKYKLPFEVNSSGAAIDITPKSINKNYALTDIQERFLIKNEEIVKIGDRGSKEGNDFDLLKHPHSFTVSEHDPDNPLQVNVPELIGVKGVEASIILLELILEKLQK